MPSEPEEGSQHPAPSTQHPAPPLLAARSHWEEVFAGCCRDPAPFVAFHSEALHNFTPERMPSLSEYIRETSKSDCRVPEKQQQRNLSPGSLGDRPSHAAPCRSLLRLAPRLHLRQKLLGFQERCHRDPLLARRQTRSGEPRQQQHAEPGPERRPALRGHGARARQ